MTYSSKKQEICYDITALFMLFVLIFVKRRKFWWIRNFTVIVIAGKKKK